MCRYRECPDPKAGWAASLAGVKFDAVPTAGVMGVPSANLTRDIINGMRLFSRPRSNAKICEEMSSDKVERRREGLVKLQPDIRETQKTGGDHLSTTPLQFYGVSGEVLINRSSLSGFFLRQAGAGPPSWVSIVSLLMSLRIRLATLRTAGQYLLPFRR